LFVFGGEEVTDDGVACGRGGREGGREGRRDKRLR